MTRLIVFDFDGVIADSESLANAVLAEIVTELGAVHAGMTAIGLLAGSHIQPGDAQRLHNAGAHHIAHTYGEVDEITRRLLA